MDTAVNVPLSEIVDAKTAESLVAFFSRKYPLTSLAESVHTGNVGRAAEIACVHRTVLKDLQDALATIERKERA